MLSSDLQIKNIILAPIRKRKIWIKENQKYEEKNKNAFTITTWKKFDRSMY